MAEYHFIWGIWWFHKSKDFEAMKAEKSAIQPKSQFLFHKNLPPRDFSALLLSTSLTRATIKGEEAENHAEAQLQSSNDFVTLFFAASA